MPKAFASLERTVKGRSAKDYTIAVAYDGKRTEDDYFRGWQLVIPPSRLTIEPFFVRSGGNPLRAVRETAKKRKNLAHVAELWCVSDVDDCDLQTVMQARQEAEELGIRLCLSNRCFEIWISLHFRRSDQPVMTAAQAVQLVQRDIPSYCKGRKVAPFDELLPRTLDAIANAQWLAHRGLENPNTHVHGLARKLWDNLPPEFREELVE